MAEETDFRDQVVALITPWRDDEHEPPFTLGEVIIMALIVSNKKMGMRDTAAWIFSNFKYYQNDAFEFVWSHSCVHYNDWHQTAPDTNVSFIEDVFDALHEFELPVEVTCPEDPEDAADWSCRTFEISSFGARQYLERILPVRRGGHFPFLSLPPELRSAIYEMVFTYPKSGLEISHEPDQLQPKVQAISRRYSDPLSLDAWQYRYESLEYLELSCPGKLLSLTLVNKQISVEALPCFYQLNSFFISGPCHGLQTYFSLASSRLKFLSSFAITLGPYDPDLNIVFSSKLSRLEGLKRLCIEMNENEWFNVSENHGEGQTFSAGNIPGFDHLLRMTDTVEVQLVGDCPTIAANWKSETQKVVEVEAKAQERSLKRKEASSNDAKQSTRAKKVRKTSLE